MGWLRLVGSIKSYVFLQNSVSCIGLFCIRDLEILSILLIEATPYHAKMSSSTHTLVYPIQGGQSIHT